MNTIPHAPLVPNQKKKGKAGTKSLEALHKTVSRNHYALLRMIDRKAAIILTVNSFIISLLLLASHFSLNVNDEAVRSFLTTISYFIPISVILALMAMLPHTYKGKAFKNSAYKGSLYAGNFAKLPLESFREDFKNTTKDRTAIFDALTLDLYFLGKAIAFKQKVLFASVATLMLGLVVGWLYVYLNF